MSIKIDEMRGKLLSLDTVYNSLSKTEPLSSHAIDPDHVRFNLKDWNENPAAAKALSDTDLVSAEIAINGRPYQLTKEALLEATSAVGLPKAFVLRTPSDYIEPALNYWFEEAEKEMKLLVVRGIGAAFTRATINPFSNLQLLDNVIAGVHDKFGDTEILVDYKYGHSLNSTNIRLIIPEQLRSMERTGETDDIWSTGIQIRNSLIGAKQTSVEGYLFRWTCTNGAIVNHVSSGVWSRKSSGQGDDVYDWARSSVDAILGGLEESLDQVQALVDVPVLGTASSILDDIYKTYKIPTAERDLITNNMVDSSEFTMYAVMQAITQVANDSDLDETHIDRLLTAGGDIPHTVAARCDSCHRKM